MVESITIRGLRGIRSGTLDDLGRLTVLTGVNGCGKSTVLDALLVTNSAVPASALVEVARRRPNTPDPLRWLVRGDAKACAIEVTDDGKKRSYELRSLAVGPNGRSVSISGAILIEAENRPLGVVSTVNGGLEVGQAYTIELDGPAKLFDPSVPVSIVESYSEAIRAGRRADILAVLSELIPGFEALEILAEQGGHPSLYIAKRGEGAIPLSVSGDGIQALVQTAVSLATIPQGLALIEEPEVFQHPGSLRHTARVLWSNVRRGLQIVLTTHSLDLIDALVETAQPDDLPQLVVLTLALQDGELRSSRVAGDDVRFARTTLESDLR